MDGPPNRKVSVCDASVKYAYCLAIGEVRGVHRMAFKSG